MLGAMRPDLLLLIADRYEMLAPASVALTLRIPIAHIEGGEISEGAIDDAVRNALTKMAHLHFTSTETARLRVIGMGEEPWRVQRAGAPSLDHLRRSRLLTKAMLEDALGLSLGGRVIVVAYHPVTIAKDTTYEAECRSSVRSRRLPCIPGARWCSVIPTRDAGSYALMARAREYCLHHANAKLFVNLSAVTYWSLLREAAVLIGNSSSGIMEAASFELPVVNVGMRQYGRERGRNILDAPVPDGSRDATPIVEAIEKTLSREFRESLRGSGNLYGDGHASERIVRVLVETPLEGLLHKTRAVRGDSEERHEDSTFCA